MKLFPSTKTNEVFKNPCGIVFSATPNLIEFGIVLQIFKIVSNNTVTYSVEILKLYGSHFSPTYDTYMSESSGVKCNISVETIVDRCMFFPMDNRYWITCKKLLNSSFTGLDETIKNYLR